MKGAPTLTSVLTGSLGRSRYRWAVLSAGLAYLLLYLYAVGQLVLDPGVSSPGGSPAFVAAADWPSRLLDPIAGYTFEPVAVLYLADGLALFLAPANLLIGVLLGGLIALNLATAVYALSTVRSCRRLSWTGLLGSLPALLTGFACCVPTVGLMLGTNLALALIGLQTVLLPLSLAALTAGLLWNLHRARRELLG